MPALDAMTELIDSTKLLFDLHRGTEIAETFSGCLEPDEIACRATDGIVEKFDCAFARIWLLEPDHFTLKLVASSGMYTRTDGKFARVPMGAYKVGKIAQNRVSFLSNNLADEPWVGDRNWAISHNIRGFAGYPIEVKGRVVGVLATFSHRDMAPEFLEFLRMLCTITAIAIDSAIRHQQEKQKWQSSTQNQVIGQMPLSDRLANILNSNRLTLVGTERSLTLSLDYIFLRAAEILNQIGSNYCRLIYMESSIVLEAIITKSATIVSDSKNWMQTIFGELFSLVSSLGGTINIHQEELQIAIAIPYTNSKLGQSLQIQCHSPVLQLAFTHLAGLAGLRVECTTDHTVPLLTDDISKISTAKRVLWIEQNCYPLPKSVQAKVHLSMSASQLREAVETVARGEYWGTTSEPEISSPLSERELEMIILLSQGLRDRDIAQRLTISESTVKFHINNILAKLKARTRFQALHLAMTNGWIH